MLRQGFIIPIVGLFYERTKVKCIRKAEYFYSIQK